MDEEHGSRVHDRPSRGLVRKREDSRKIYGCPRKRWPLYFLQCPVEYPLLFTSSFFCFHSKYRWYWRFVFLFTSVHRFCCISFSLSSFCCWVSCYPFWCPFFTFSFTPSWDFLFRVTCSWLICGDLLVWDDILRVRRAADLGGSLSNDDLGSIWHGNNYQLCKTWRVDANNCNSCSKMSVNSIIAFSFLASSAAGWANDTSI